MTPQTTTDKRPTRQGLRAIVFVAVVTFMFAGPAYRQVFDGHNPMFRQWQMYRNIGVGMVSFEVERWHEGEWRALDYATALRRELRLRERAKLRVKKVVVLDRIELKLCQLYPGQKLRLNARQATLDRGWVTLNDGTAIKCPWRP